MVQFETRTKASVILLGVGVVVLLFTQNMMFYTPPVTSQMNCKYEYQTVATSKGPVKKPVYTCSCPQPPEGFSTKVVQVAYSDSGETKYRSQCVTEPTERARYAPLVYKSSSSYEVEGSQGNESLQDGELSVMTYNVRLIPCVDIDEIFYHVRECDNQSGREDLQKSHIPRAAAIGRFLKRQHESKDGADIVLVQEAWLANPYIIDQKEMKALLRAFADSGYPYVAVGPDSKKVGKFDLAFGSRRGIYNSGLFILSRYKIEKVFQTSYDSCVGEACYTMDGAVMVRVKPANSDTSIDVAVTHAQADGKGSDGQPDPRREKVRASQLADFHRFVTTHSRGDILLVGGDFNTKDGSVFLQKSFSELKKMGVISSLDYCSRSPGKCECPKEDPKCELKKAGAVKNIDHILHMSTSTTSLALRPVAYEILNPTFNWGEKTLPLSDHKPAIAHFQVDRVSDQQVCSEGGLKLSVGEAQTFYKQETVTDGTSCAMVGQVRRCNSSRGPAGVLDGQSEFKYAQCKVVEK